MISFNSFNSYKEKKVIHCKNQLKMIIMKKIIIILINKQINSTFTLILATNNNIFKRKVTNKTKI